MRGRTRRAGPSVMHEVWGARSASRLETSGALRGFHNTPRAAKGITYLAWRSEN